jgi:hypothetical protein
MGVGERDDRYAVQRWHAPVHGRVARQPSLDDGYEGRQVSETLWQGIETRLFAIEPEVWCPHMGRYDETSLIDAEQRLEEITRR